MYGPRSTVELPHRSNDAHRKVMLFNVYRILIVMRHNVSTQLALVRAMDETNDRLEMLLRIESLKRLVNCRDNPYRSRDLRSIAELSQSGATSSMVLASLSRKATMFQSRNLTITARRNSKGRVASIKLRRDDTSEAGSVHSVMEEPEGGEAGDIPASPSPNESPTLGAPLSPRLEKGPATRFNVDDSSNVNAMRPNYRRRMSQGIIQLGQQGMNKYGEAVEADVKETVKFKGFHPLSPFVAAWDFITIFPYLLVLFVSPVTIAFESFDPYFTLISCSVCAMYTVDTVIRLFILQKKGDDKMHSFKESILLNVYSLTFAIDLFTSIPGELILRVLLYNPISVLPQLFFAATKILRFHRMPALFQGPHMRRMAHLFRTALNVGVNFMSINTFFMALIVFLHWHCCFLFLMPRVYGYVDNRWKSLGVFDMSPAYRYSWGLWAGISNTFSVTSEFEPDIIYELWGHCVLPTLSGLLLATFQGLVSALSAGVESPTGRFRQQVDDVDEYIESKMMDDAMASKIRDYFNFKYRGKIFNQEQIIAMMSDRLREDIQLHNWQAMLMQVPFLNRFGDDRKSDGLLAQIASAMTESHFVQGDTIFRQGEHGDCMYFIMIGDVSAFVDGVKVGHLSCGSYFGEMALMAVIPRTATIKAATSCKCAKLHRDSLMTILINFPEIAVQMKAIFMERLAVLQAMKE